TVACMATCAVVGMLVDCLPSTSNAPERSRPSGREMSPRHDPRPPGVVSIVLVGVVSLAVAIGIGRFAFTPLLPLMMRDGAIDAATGAEWAAANYGGYLIGAVSAPWLGRRMLPSWRIALGGVVVST